MFRILTLNQWADAVQLLVRSSGRSLEGPVTLPGRARRCGYNVRMGLCGIMKYGVVQYGVLYIV